MRRPNLVPIFRWLTVLTAGLVLIQALFAGRGLWLNRTFIDYHEILANVLFIVVVAATGIDVRHRNPWRSWETTPRAERGAGDFNVGADRSWL